ncbi:MAG: COQ9 family protein [Rhodospirillales bacterium]|nr:COQ9 family protein [Rhodospirillales bacterium]
MTDTDPVTGDGGDVAGCPVDVAEERVRERILLAALPHVAFEGWRTATLHAAYADTGLSVAEGELAFPGGAVEIIEYWSDWADRQMLAAADQPDFASLRMPDRIATLMRARIEVNGRWREAVRRTMSFLALPSNTGRALKCTWRTLNAIWYACGDTATDLGFYSKRLSLAAVYAAVVLYWLDDSSEDFADTWAFLDRRIDTVMLVPKLRGRVRDTLADVLSPLRSRRPPVSSN